MESQGTCGKGLAEHSALPAKLAGIIGALARYRDLPMGRHDEKTISGPQVRAAFEKFVKVEQELRAMLEKRVEQDRTMLAAMGGR
jgi:hypothetical protein